MLRISESKENLFSFAERKQYRTLMSAKIMKIFHFLPNILVFSSKIMFFYEFRSDDTLTLARLTTVKTSVPYI